MCQRFRMIRDRSNFPELIIPRIPFCVDKYKFGFMLVSLLHEVSSDVFPGCMDEKKLNLGVLLSTIDFLYACLVKLWVFISRPLVCTQPLAITLTLWSNTPTSKH